MVRWARGGTTRGVCRGPHGDALGPPSGARLSMCVVIVSCGHYQVIWGTLWSFYCVVALPCDKWFGLSLCDLRPHVLGMTTAVVVAVAVAAAAGATTWSCICCICCGCGLKEGAVNGIGVETVGALQLYRPGRAGISHGQFHKGKTWDLDACIYAKQNM
jgi:hypothetical protein